MKNRIKGYCNVHEDDSHLSIKRIACGNKRFYYRYASGKKVTGQRVINRIKKLVIPPNWRDTFISRDSKASVQAIGYDEKGRKQYIYHEKWHEQQQVQKFERLIAFGNALPAFREHCISLISQSSWTLERACALVCLLLDYTGARVGNTQYSKENNTYGLTTLRRKHVQAQCDDSVELAYIGKHGKPRTLKVNDPELASLICDCAQQQGYCLFRYQDHRKQWHDVTSEDVNAFIHEKLSEQFSCKDFRTWASSRFALTVMPNVYERVASSKTKKWESTLSKTVSAELGNTPAVCRKYYIHPKLFVIKNQGEAFEKTLNRVRSLAGEDCTHITHLLPVEKLLLDVISTKSNE
ncbi:MAG: DNA topoisomerase IB [Gammaproteobacteria bacterium]|nr:DNA topoisomerase IB [Gammaproteobacteria bacterium]